MLGRIGQQLGNYRLVRLLGRGGFAEVYLGEHVRLNTQAAIKVLHSYLDESDVKSFLTEAQTIAYLEHPSIVRILDFDVKEGTPFLVMGYAPRGTLRQQHPKGTRLPLATIIHYVQQLTEALQYAHDKKLIHRDIKPENMLVGKRDEILLSDFGIAVLVQGSQPKTQKVVGTIPYMSPEQLQGKPHVASDQYALGITVYEWICGDRPFHGTFTELFSQHLFVPPPSLHEKDPAIPLEVEHVVLKALDKNVNGRFPSIRAFAENLQLACRQASTRLINVPLATPQPKQNVISTNAETLVLSDQTESPTNSLPPENHVLPTTSAATIADTLPSPSPISHTIEISRQQKISPFSPSRRTVLVGIAGFTTLLSIGGWSLWSLFHPGSPATENRGHINTPSGSGSPRMGTNMATSPQSTPARTGTPVPGTILTEYHGHAGPVNSVAWSPDGKSIASAGAEHEVHIWEASTGHDLVLFDGPQNSVRSVDWQPDGKYIASGGDDRVVQVWIPVKGVQVSTIEFKGHTNSISSVAWSLDNSRIVSGSDDKTARIWDFANPGVNNIVYTSHTGAITSVAWSPDGKQVASASLDKTVHIWDATKGSTILIFTEQGNAGPFQAVAWSPKGTAIVSAMKLQYFSPVLVWNVSTGNILTYYSGHIDEVLAVAWSPGGTRVASGGRDQSIQIWDADTGKNVFLYRGHFGAKVTTIKWSPDGTRIASGDDNGVVQVWSAK